VADFELPFPEGSVQHVLLQRLRRLHGQLDDSKRDTKEYERLSDQIRELANELNRLPNKTATTMP